MFPARDSRITRAMLIVFFLLAVAYAYYEGRGILFGPSITVATGPMQTSTQFIKIEGRADRATTLTMNGNPVSITESGNFSEPYVLAPGYNRIVLEASDKYGKHVARMIEIVYTPTLDAFQTSTSASSSTPAMAH